MAQGTKALPHNVLKEYIWYPAEVTTNQVMKRLMMHADAASEARKESE